MGNTLMKSKRFRLWILCYLFMLLIPLAFGFLLYHSNTRLLEERAYDNGMASVGQLGRIMDEQLKSVYRISDAICIQSDVISLGEYRLPYDAKKYYDIHAKAKTLSVYAAHQEQISAIYVYQQELGCLIDAGHIYTEDNQYARIIERVFGMSVAGFEEMMVEGHHRELYFSEDGSKCLLFQTVSTDYRRQTHPVTLILVLNTEPIRALLKSTGDSYEGRAFMRLGDASVYGQAAPDETPAEEMVTCTYDSETSALEYLLMIPKAALFRDVGNSRLVFFYCIVCTLIFGSMLAYFFAKRNYKPLRQLTQSISADESGGDEFVVLGNRLRELKAHCEEIQSEVDRLEVFENAQTFSALLDGDLSALDTTQRTHLSQLLSGELFVCAYISDDTPATGEGRRYIVKEVSRQLNLLTASVCQCIVRYHGSKLCTVFCFSRGTNPYDAQLFVKQATEKLLKLSRETPESSALSIYVGDAQAQLGGISLSLRNALKAKEYTDFVSEGEHQVVLYDHMMYAPAVTWQDCDIADVERRFASVMITGNYAASEQLMKDIMAYYAGHDGLSLYQMRMRMFGVMNMMVGVLHAVEADFNDAFTEEANPLEQLMTVRTMQELEDVSIQIIRHLAEHQQSDEGCLADKLTQVANFIEANYADPNLSVQMLADEFSLSLPYLSREFKVAKGTGVLSYINECRIRHAKQLLNENDSMTIADAAKAVGYSSSQTLIRIFKRYVGTTPGVFKAGKG